METDSPIFVTGMPRSGTTLMQHWLSRHPRIVIHGQEPTACSWGEWLRHLLDGVDFTHESNTRLDYEAPHYAAPEDRNEAATRFLEFVKWYLTGGLVTPRWGSKSLTQCRVLPETLPGHWPDTKWIVCVRDPFRCIESLRNTFDTASLVSIETACEWWVDAVEFAHNRPEAILIQTDQLQSHETRLEIARQLCAATGESMTDELQQFADEWPVVHEVVAESERRFRLGADERHRMLDNHPLLASWAGRLGYLEPVGASA